MRKTLIAIYTGTASDIRGSSRQDASGLVMLTAHQECKNSGHGPAARRGGEAAG
jgi:hypothetical protein